jgi:hypothetical protein
MVSVPMLGAWYDIFQWYTVVMLIGVIGLVIFLVLYRRRQL